MADRVRAGLRSSWGQPATRVRDLRKVSVYHQQVAAPDASIEDQTWRDLDLDQVFARIDHTTSGPGRQVLYHQLRSRGTDPAVAAERIRQQDCFTRDPAYREELQLALRHLAKADAEWTGAEILGAMPPRPWFAPLLYLSSLATLAAIVGIPFVHALFLPAMILMFANVAITALYGRNITPFFAGFSQIVTMLAVGQRLARQPDPHGLPQLARLRQARASVARLRRNLGWLAFDRSALPDIAGALLGYLNMIFLLDILVYLRARAGLEANREEISDFLEAIGSLDSSIAVASYLSSVGPFVRPVVVDAPRIAVAGLYHPLIDGAVGNSLELTGHSALITGPNMAGKTAFIRTVGVNVILAQAFGFALATEATLPRAQVRSAIRREDDLEAGQSYFFAEIDQILNFIRLPEGEGRQLILVDELYRGTNTVERIAASAAVLRELAGRHLVLATTHDVELGALLAGTYEMFHFTDHVKDGKYGFDYRIEAGPARSRNAIRLLAITGYPPAVIAEAERLASRPGTEA